MTRSQDRGPRKEHVMRPQRIKGSARILFIEPKAPDYHIFSLYPLPRLGPVILGTILEKEGFAVEVAFEQTDPVTLERIAASDIVAITTTTSTAPRAYGFADLARRLDNLASEPLPPPSDVEIRPFEPTDLAAIQRIAARSGSPGSDRPMRCCTVKVASGKAARRASHCASAKGRPQPVALPGCQTCTARS